MQESPPPHVQRLIEELRRALPLRASVRSESLAFSRTQAPGRTQSLRCTVTHVYYLDEAAGPMCRIDFGGDSPGTNIFVLPIARLNFERGRPVAREVALYRKRRLERLAAQRGETRLTQRAAAEDFPVR